MKIQIISMMMFRNQLFSVTAYSGMFVLSSAFVDYNRDVSNANKNLSFTLPPKYLA